jgi:hypothetical protein
VARLLGRRRNHDAVDHDGTPSPNRVSAAWFRLESANRIQFAQNVYQAAAFPLPLVCALVTIVSPMAGLISSCVVAAVSIAYGTWITRCDQRARRRQENEGENANERAIRLQEQLDVALGRNRELDEEVQWLRAKIQEQHADHEKTCADHEVEAQRVWDWAERVDKRAECAEKEIQLLRAELDRSRSRPSTNSSLDSVVIHARKIYWISGPQPRTLALSRTWIETGFRALGSHKRVR